MIGSDVGTDFVAITLPIPMVRAYRKLYRASALRSLICKVWTLHMSTTRKFGLASVFLVGLLSVYISLLHFPNSELIFGVVR